MEFDRSQIFAPVSADTVPRFAQRPRTAPGLADQLPSSSIRSSGGDAARKRLRVLVRGIPDYVDNDTVSKDVVEPFSADIDSWYVTCDGMDLDVDTADGDADLSKPAVRLYVQFKDKDSLHRFHRHINQNVSLCKKWAHLEPASEVSESEEQLPDRAILSHILEVEYSPLPSFSIETAAEDPYSGTIEEDPLYIKFCENPDELLFEGGEGRVMEPILAPTAFEMESIIPVGVPLQKIAIPEDELVMLPAEKKKREKKAAAAATTEKDKAAASASDDKKKKRSRKKKDKSPSPGPSPASERTAEGRVPAPAPTNAWKDTNAPVANATSTASASGAAIDRKAASQPKTNGQKKQRKPQDGDKPKTEPRDKEVKKDLPRVSHSPIPTGPKKNPKKKKEGTTGGSDSASCSAGSAGATPSTPVAPKPKKPRKTEDGPGQSGAANGGPATPTAPKQPRVRKPKPQNANSPSGLSIPQTTAQASGEIPTQPRAQGQAQGQAQAAKKKRRPKKATSAGGSSAGSATSSSAPPAPAP